MKEAEYRLLKEALFRYLAFHHDEPIRWAWTGLGYKTEYKPALDAGLMEWVNGEPLPRVAGWLRLTEAGVEIVQGWLDNGYTFEDALAGKWPER